VHAEAPRNYPTADSNPLNIVADSAGNVWFVESTSNQIGRLSFGR